MIFFAPTRVRSKGPDQIFAMDELYSKHSQEHNGLLEYNLLSHKNLAMDRPRTSLVSKQHFPHCWFSSHAAFSCTKPICLCNSLWSAIHSLLSSPPGRSVRKMRSGSGMRSSRSGRCRYSFTAAPPSPSRPWLPRSPGRRPRVLLKFRRDSKVYLGRVWFYNRVALLMISFSVSVQVSKLP